MSKKSVEKASDRLADAMAVELVARFWVLEVDIPSAKITRALERRAKKTNEPWVLADGCGEPFELAGRLLLHVAHERTGRRAYLDLKEDRILTVAEEEAAFA